VARKKRVLVAVIAGSLFSLALCAAGWLAFVLYAPDKVVWRQGSRQGSALAGNDRRYVVRLGTSLGKSMTYSSETGNWVPLNVGYPRRTPGAFPDCAAAKNGWPPINTDEHG
jgi:hypothetical protein